MIRNKAEEYKNRNNNLSVLGLVLTKSRLKCHQTGSSTHDFCTTFHQLLFPTGCSWMSHRLLEQLVLILPFQQLHRRISKTAKNNRDSKFNALGSEDFIKETAMGNWNNHRQAEQVITVIKMVFVLFQIIFLATSRSWKLMQGRQESIAFPYDRDQLKYARTYHIIREHVLSLGF